MSDLGPSFQIAADLKNQAYAESAQLRLELAAAQARIEQLEVLLDNEQARHREAAAQLELTKSDRSYWQGQHDQLAKELYFVYCMLGEIRSFTTPR